MLLVCSWLVYKERLAPPFFTSPGFTLLALELPGSAPQDLQPHPVLSIMQCFGWDDMLHPLLVTRYLVHLLQNRWVTSDWIGAPVRLT